MASVLSARPVDEVQTNKKTRLDNSLWVPWHRTFQLGGGVDALTGEGTDTALITGFEVSKPQYDGNRHIGYISFVDYSRVESEIKKRLNTEVRGTINLCPPSPASLGLELGAKFSKFMQNYKESITVYVDYHLSGEWPDPVRVSKAELRSDARKLSTEEFRRRYNVESIMQRAEKMLNVARARYELVRDLRERPIEPLQLLHLQDTYKWECGLVEHDVFRKIDEGEERIKLRNLTGKESSRTTVLIGHILSTMPSDFIIGSQFCHSPHRTRISPRITGSCQ